MKPRRWPPSRIRTHPRRGKDELPPPFDGCVRVFPVERERQHDPSQPSCEIGLVLSLHKLEMANQRLDDGDWQYGRPVLLAFAASNHNLPPLQIDVLHAEFQAFLQPQARAVQENHRYPRDAVEMVHDARNLVAAQDNRYANRQASTRNLVDGA